MEKSNQDIPNELKMFLAFCKARNLSPDDLKTSCNNSKSIWGDLSRHIFGRNRPDLRKKLYLKWKNNSHSVHSLLQNDHLPYTPDKNFHICIGLWLLSIKKRTSLVTSAILIDISASLHGNNLTAILPFSQFDLKTIELSLLDCDNILIVCSSVSYDLDSYNKFVNKYEKIPLPTENILGQPLFYSFITYESKLWLDGCNYYDLEGPKIIPGFLQFAEMCQFEACQEFETSLRYKFTDYLVEQSMLIMIWIISTQKEIYDSNNKFAYNLFNKNYVLLNSSMLTNFGHWVEELKTDFEKNGIGVLASIYADYKAKFNNNVHNLKDKRQACKPENINDENRYVPSCSVAQNCTYEDDAIQTFGEFFLDQKEWNSISYLDKDGKNRMNRDWTNHISRKYSEINSICVLKFKHYWFKKTDGRKLRCPFFQAWAECKFTNCISVSFLIENDIVPFGNDVITMCYNSNGVLSSEHKDNKTIHARHIVSSERKKMGEILIKKSVSSIFYKQFSKENNIDAFKRGNFTNLKSQQTLRRIKSDTKSIDRFSNDDIEDILETQQHFRSLLPDYPISGYIQYVVHDPFIIHLYSKKQIEVFKLFKHDNIALNIDATGSLIKNPPTCKKSIYYYALTLHHPLYSISPVPVAEMISSDQGTAEITHFLNKWVLSSKLILHRDLNIDQIEMDYSWAILHSSCLAFNKLSISLYLSKCWNIVNSNSITKLTFPTVLHLCSAHIMHRVSHKLDQNYKIDKKVKRLILHAFGTMVKSRTIEEIDPVFESLCILLTTDSISPLVTKSVLDLEALVKGEIEIKSTDSDYIDEDSENIGSDTYRKTSPFGRYFEEQYLNAIAKISVQKLQVDNKNDCYYPKIIEYFLTYYMPLLPLWSGIILNKVKASGASTDSNAQAENWFKIVKHSIFKSQTNIRVGDFVRCMFAHIDDRLSSFKFAFEPLGNRVFKARKRGQDVSNEEECKEFWKRRKNSKNSYINPNKSQVTKVFSKFNQSNLKSYKMTNPSIDHEKSTAKCPKTDKLEETSKQSKQITEKQADIITDLDIIALGSIYVILQPFKPLSLLGQANLCNILELPLVNEKFCNLDFGSCHNRDNLNLNELVPSVTFAIPGDGNCLFSTLSYIITGSIDYNHRIRIIITENIIGELSQVCLKYIQNKFPLTFRNTKQYITKSGMNIDKTWGGDVELFTIALLLKTDIWVNTTEMGNKWMIYSGKGASLFKIMETSPANDDGSCYIKHTGNHYEPILELTRNMSCILK